MEISIPAPPRGASQVRGKCPQGNDFNTSPSTRGFGRREGSKVGWIFQYQPLHEGLHSVRMRSSTRRYFNTSPSTRGFKALTSICSVTLFQYQPLHEGLRAPPSRCILSRPFQYQPLHEGLLGAGPERHGRRISIPAPPRGASCHGRSADSRQLDFNTSPSTRGFGMLSRPRRGQVRFQYQPLHEGLQTDILRLLLRMISIPAPPRGASASPLQRPLRAEFQYQPLHEGLPRCLTMRKKLMKFQYQPLHEGLPRPPITMSWNLSFQYQPLHEGLRQGGDRPGD